MKKLFLLVILLVFSLYLTFVLADTSGTNYTLRSNLKKDLTITGSLPMQNDLDMDGFDILNAGDIDVDTLIGLTSIQWDLTTVDTPAEGLMYWNDDDGTLNIGMPGGNVNLQIGQEINKRVRNVTGSTILNGTPVYISGSSGTKLTIAPGDATFAVGVGFRTYAVATEDILHNSNGYVTKLGVVRDIDLSTFAVGVPLYLAVGGAGSIENYYTTTPPTAPDVTVLVGIVERATSSGELDVRITSIPNLNSLSDVQGSVADNDMLQWDAATNTWDNTKIVEGLTSLTSAALSITSEYTLPLADGPASGDIMKTDGAGVVAWVTPTVNTPILLSMYDSSPSRAEETNWNGGFQSLDTGESLSSGSPLVMVSKGIGKVVLVVNEGIGDDMVGTVTATGTQIDRDTGLSLGSQTSVMTLTGVTTDASTTDVNGNIKHMFTKAYITDKWFTGVVTLTTTDVTLTDLDTYHISFEQFNDKPGITLNTFDASLLCTESNSEFDAYLYVIRVTDDECAIQIKGELHLGSETGYQAAQNDKYFRLRKGNIADSLDGTTDGIWVDVFYARVAGAGIEDVTMKIWATQSTGLTYGATAPSLMLLETGDSVLLETGDGILLEL